MIQTTEKIAYVPVQFRQPDTMLYPEDNSPDFERWFFENIKPEEIPDDWVYLPIYFTSYLKRNRFGADRRALMFLQDFIDNLDRTKKYFTIVQYDDGTLVDLRELNVKVFAMSGKPEGSIPIPLVSQPHKFTFPNVTKDILCSFVGRNTHPLRRVLLDQLSDKKGFFVTDRHHSLKDYCHVLAKSVFSLCPRGYGLNSFRIGESLQYGAIPIIITDNSDIHLFEDKLPLIQLSSIEKFDIVTVLQQIIYGRVAVDMQSVVPSLYSQCYKFESVKKYIIQNLSL